MPKIIQTDNAPAAIGPYSQGISTKPFLFVSGQLGMNPETGDLVGGDLDSQAHQAIENIGKIVQAGGGGFHSIVSVDVYLTDITKFAEFNVIYEKYFSQYKPSRAVVEVSALPKGACVEIKCIAFIEE